MIALQKKVMKHGDYPSVQRIKTVDLSELTVTMLLINFFSKFRYFCIVDMGLKKGILLKKIRNHSYHS